MTGELILGIDWLDTHPWNKAILITAAGEQPAGKPVDELDGFDEVDEELMKRGTLQHSNIRWAWVGDQTSKLMEQSKDIRLLSAMLNAAQHTSSKPVFPLAIILTAQFFSRWGSEIYPRTRMLPKLSVRIAEQLSELFPKDMTIFEETGLFEACIKAASLCSGVDQKSFPEVFTFFDSLPKRLETLKADEEKGVGQQAIEHSEAPTIRPEVSSSTSGSEAAKAPDLSLDTSNERMIKQSLVSISDFLQQRDIEHPLSYRLRRYATWYGISSLPPVKSGHKSVLQAVSEETIDRYRAAIERAQVDSETVTKLERTCHLQPFWIEGQFLASRLASAAGRDDVAQAIYEETLRFVATLPGINEMLFANGTPFISKEVALWLETKPENDIEVELEVAPEVQGGEPVKPQVKPNETNGFVAVDRQFQTTIRSVRASAKKGDYGGALKLLDQARENSDGKRTACLWEIVTLEALSEWGLKSNVSSQAVRLSEAIEQMPLSEWEPEILRRLGRLI